MKDGGQETAESSIYSALNQMLWKIKTCFGLLPMKHALIPSPKEKKLRSNLAQDLLNLNSLLHLF